MKYKVGLFVLIICCALFIFFKKDTIPYEKVTTIEVASATACPIGYIFIHDKEEMKSKIKLITCNNDSIISYTDTLFDFDRFSYILIEGCEIKELYHSYYSDYFIDISPSWVKKRDGIFVNAVVAETKEHCFYIYKVKKNQKYRGHFDC